MISEAKVCKPSIRLVWCRAQRLPEIVKVTVLVLIFKFHQSRAEPNQRLLYRLPETVRLELSNHAHGSRVRLASSLAWLSSW
jgi:hypothetical protein